MTTGVREPVAAGTLYSADAQTLRSNIDEMLALATVEMGSPKVLIVPHGGYAESGQTAAAGYGLLAAERGKIERVVILAPSHHVAFEGIAVPRNVAFRTPLGDILVDHGVVEDLSTLSNVTLSDRPHQREVTIELQLPFIQRMIGRVQIVPLVVGKIGASALANVLEMMWGGAETLIVLSADLSHDLSHEATMKQDQLTVEEITDLSIENIDASRTCASHALRGLLTLARRRGMTASALATSTTADVDGKIDSVVGFGSFGLWESPLLPLDPDTALHLLELVESAANTVVLGGLVEGADPERLPPQLKKRRAAFVNSFVDGELRGSAGSLEAQATLAGAVVRHAARAVTDERLGPITAAERDNLTLGVSVLGPLERIRPTSMAELVALLTPGVDGLLARSGKGRATFLPAVWTSFPDPEQFVSHLFERAHIDADVPLADVVLHRYQGHHYGAS